jgi:hypothetical protein
MEDDTGAVDDVDTFSVNQLNDCLCFLEQLYASNCKSLLEKHHYRALVALSAIEDRWNSILEEFNCFDFTTNEYCDGGISTMITTTTERQIQTIANNILTRLRQKQTKYSIRCHSKAMRGPESVYDPSLVWKDLKQELTTQLLFEGIKKQQR